MQTPGHTPHLLNCTWRALSFFLSGSHSRHTGRFATSSHELHLVLLQGQTTQFHIVRYSPNSLSTVQDTFIIIGPLHVFDVIFAEEARDVRFGLVAVIIPMRCSEQSRRQKQAGSSLRDFHESLWRVSRSSSTILGENGVIQKHLLRFRSRHLSRFQASHVKAAQRTKALQLLEVFLAERHKKHQRLRLRHHPIDETS